jgi:hypothetical protein
MDVTERDSPGLDFTSAASSRVYNYALGGKDNFAKDRQLAADMAAACAVTRKLPRENRKFMRRAVRFMLDAGVRQFIDIGCGLPGRGNVHDVVHAVDPQASVVYVDSDPVAVVHYQSLLHADPTATVIRADARKPTEVLGHPEVTALIDFDRPVGVLIVATLHLVTDEEDPDAIAAAFRAAMAPGSYLALCDLASDNLTDTDWAVFHELTDKHGIVAVYRCSDRLKEFFGDLELVEPGLVNAPEWRPDREHEPPSGWLLAAVARKR